MSKHEGWVYWGEVRLHKVTTELQRRSIGPKRPSLFSVSSQPTILSDLVKELRFAYWRPTRLTYSS